MRTKEEERNIKQIRQRFLRKYGEGKWVKLKRYIFFGLSSREIARLLSFSQSTVIFWKNKLKK